MPSLAMVKARAITQLTIRGRIIVWLVSGLTRLDVTASLRNYKYPHIFFLTQIQSSFTGDHRATILLSDAECSLVKVSNGQCA